MFKNIGSGVYIIVNNINNKSYIGSSNHLKRRYYEHYKQLLSNIHPNSKLQNAFNKYGLDSFSFKIIEFCDKEKCIEREQYYLDKYKPYYNLNKEASGRLHSNHTEQTKQLLSYKWSINKEERVKILSESNYIKKRKAVLKFSKTGEFIEEFPSIKEAGESLCLKRPNDSKISSVCKHNRKSAHGFKWEYKK